MVCKCEFRDKSIFIQSIIGYNKYAQEQLISDNDTILFKNSTSLVYKELIGVLVTSPFANIIKENVLFYKFTIFCFLGLCEKHYYAFFTHYIHYIIKNDIAKKLHNMLITKVLRTQEDKNIIYIIFFDEYMNKKIDTTEEHILQFLGIVPVLSTESSFLCAFRRHFCKFLMIRRLSLWFFDKVRELMSLDDIILLFNTFKHQYAYNKVGIYYNYVLFDTFFFPKLANRGDRMVDKYLVNEKVSIYLGVTSLDIVYYKNFIEPEDKDVLREYKFYKNKIKILKEDIIFAFLRILNINNANLIIIPVISTIWNISYILYIISLKSQIVYLRIEETADFRASIVATVIRKLIKSVQYISNLKTIAVKLSLKCLELILSLIQFLPNIKSLLIKYFERRCEFHRKKIYFLMHNINILRIFQINSYFICMFLVFYNTHSLLFFCQKHNLPKYILL